MPAIEAFRDGESTRAERGLVPRLAPLQPSRWSQRETRAGHRETDEADLAHRHPSMSSDFLAGCVVGAFVVTILVYCVEAAAVLYGNTDPVLPPRKPSSPSRWQTLAVPLAFSTFSLLAACAILARQYGETPPQQSPQLVRDDDELTMVTPASLSSPKKAQRRVAGAVRPAVRSPAAYQDTKGSAAAPRLGDGTMADLTGRCCPAARAVLAWNPQQLEPWWWLPSSSWDDRPLHSPPNCSAVEHGAPRGTFRQLGAPYGRTNNHLIETVRLFQFAVARLHSQPWWNDTAAPHTAPTAPSLVLARDFAWQFGRFFDWHSATQPWSCVRLGPPSEAMSPALINQTGRDAVTMGRAFFARQMPTSSAFAGTLLAQILLRPREALRQRVEKFERESLGGACYVAVHLRGFEGACAKETGKRLSCVSPSASAARDLCTMSTRYVASALAASGRSNCTLFVAHDGQQPREVQRLVTRYGAKVMPPRVNATDAEERTRFFAEMLLLLRSCYFVGNPASTLAGNIARARAALLGEGASNIRMASTLRRVDDKHMRTWSDMCYGMNP